jgi:hypothetical protein
MRNIIWFLALFILLLIQGGVLLPFHMVPVNLILIVVALTTILSDFKPGLIITLLGGLLLDFLSGSADGLITMSLLIVFLVLQLILSEFLSREPNKFILAATILGATIVYYLAFFIASKLFVVFGLADNPDARYLFTILLPLAIMWNLLFAYPVYLYYIVVQNLASKLPTNEEPIRT